MLHPKNLLNLLLVLFIALVLFIGGVYLNKRDVIQSGAVRNPIYETSIDEQARLQSYAHQLKTFASLHHYNTSVCFLADMKLHSGKYRFFVYDMEKDIVKSAGLVAHGSCKTLFLVKAKFSNTPNCNCSSIGKYKVSAKYKGRFGYAFKLIGLDSSNSNAYKRSIVLHRYSCIPEEEAYPLPICNSLGCPMVANAFFQVLTAEIDHSKKPVLLWMLP
jgi:hypothetical protein